MNRTLFKPSALFFPTLLLALAAGCHAGHDPATPEFSPGEGAITGQLINSDKDPFNLSLAGDDGAKALKIELLSPSTGVAAVTYPQKEKSRFTFSHISPGRYEISVFAVVTGKRTIAGSAPITVDPGKIAPAIVKLTVSPVQN
jgi:hypothetical protein